MTENPAARPRSSAESSASLEFEAPTAAAELHIVMVPVEERRADGTVPAHQARSLVTTLGDLASLIVGVGGAVLTLSLAPGITGVAFAAAELVLAAVVAVLITVAARNPRRRLP